MRQAIFFLMAILAISVKAQIAIPISSGNCKQLSKKDFAYCLDTTNFKIQWTATKIKGSNIENQIYLPPDREFFKDMPVALIPVWQSIELQTNFWAMDFDSVFVATGIANTEIDSVPVKAYYKAILKACKGDALAFFVNINSTNTNITKYAITINELEQLTGMDFFPTLDKDLQEVFESYFDWEFWPVLLK